MANLNGTYSQRNPLSRFRIEAIPTWLEYLLLVGLGVAAVVLHQVFRFPMNLPGRHGVEWMALLILGRGLSRSRYAGSIASIGASAASMLPIWGISDDPFIWLIYLLPGLIMDLAFSNLTRWKGSLVFLGSLGALAHGTKPLARWVINLSLGFPYGSLLWGVAYPLATHLLFGAIGGVLGGMAALGIKKLVEKKP
jgi:hypothetical protein